MLNRFYKFLFYILIAISLVGCKACESDCPDLNSEQTKWALFAKDEQYKDFKFVDKLGDTSILKPKFFDNYFKGGGMRQCAHHHEYTLEGILKNNKDSTCSNNIRLFHRISDNDEVMSLCSRINEITFFKDLQNNEYKKLSFFPNDSNYVVLKKNEGIVKINLVSNSYLKIK